VYSQAQGLAAVSEMVKFPSAPEAKRTLTAAVSSTSKPRWAFKTKARMLSISPAMKRTVSRSWIRLISSGPPPGLRGHSWSK